MTGKLLLFLLVWLMPLGRAFAAETLSQGVCEQAALNAEREAGIPERLLVAVSSVESGRRDPVSRVFGPWPWTINAQGKGYFYDSKAEAIAAARLFEASGITSIDVGCMQINLHHHPDAFASLDDAFDPQINARYGAHFLSMLHDQLQAWPGAVGAYHSMTPGLGEDYARKVMSVWAQLRGLVTVPALLSSPLVAETSTRQPLPPSRPFSPTMVSYAPPPRIIHHNFSGGPATVGGHGRDLASYRATPVRLAMQR